MQKKQIIVSLTSFPAALPFAAQAIQSILNGSVLPDKIVLYLTTQQFPGGKIPSDLQDLLTLNSTFEVRFCNQIIRSYTKLIPAIQDFPNDIIVGRQSGQERQPVPTLPEARHRRQRLPQLTGQCHQAAKQR